MASEPSYLLALPYDVLVDNILPNLEAPDLASLRLVNRHIKALVDEDLIWKAKIQQDFNFPPHASSRQTGWQRLYRGLAQPTVFVWGQFNNARLGIPPAELSEELQQFISRHQGAPFPLKLKYRLEAADAGPPVEIVAGGWSFHCLTAKGEILYHGQLDGFQYGQEISSPGCRVLPPRVLRRSTSDPVKALSCGRAHGVALTSEQDILEWHNWNLAIKHERLIQLAGDNPTWIAQLEAGWDSTAVLIHSKNKDSTKSSQVVWWYTQDLENDRLVREGSDGSSTWEGVHRATLPPLPEVSDAVAEELDERDHSSHTFITCIAAGESWLVALTASGLLYKIGLEPNHPNRRPEWVLLDTFCLPSKIATLKHFASQDDESIQRLVHPKLRITHINAQFRTFAAYTPSISSDGGIVLLGEGDSTEGTEPLIKPELQGAGVIKVSMGDWHYGALTIEGKVMTWGAWSHGALGIWDSLPSMTSSGRDDHQQGGGADRVIRGGRGPGPFFPTMDNQLPAAGRNTFGNRVRIGLAAARGRSRGGVRAGAGSGTGREPANEAGTADPWRDRLRPRRIPQSVEEPTLVQFDPEKPDRDFVFDIAFAGWHSAAIAIPAGLIKSSGKTQAEEGANEGQEVEDEDEDEDETLHSSKLDAFQLGSSPSSSSSPTTQARSGSLSFLSTIAQSRFPPPPPPAAAAAAAASRLNAYALDADSTLLQRSFLNEQRARNIRNSSLLFLLFGAFSILGGWESLFSSLLQGDLPVVQSGYTTTTAGAEGGGMGVGRDQRDDSLSRVLFWPVVLLTFVPLLVPLTLYFVIARWTGRQLYGGFAQ